MNSLTMGFLYLTGIGWALAECCVLASNGNWIPLSLFLAGFVLMFGILGCIRISKKAVDMWGTVFALLLAAGLVFFAFATWSTGASVLGVLKGIGAAGFVVAGLLTMFSGGSKHVEAHSAAG